MTATGATSLPEYPPPGLQIVVRERDATITLELAGEWDLAQKDATAHAIGQALQGRPEALVLDLSRVCFIDSTGVHGLIEAHHRCAAHGIRLAIMPGPRAVQHVLEICGLAEALPFAQAAGPGLSDR